MALYEGVSTKDSIETIRATVRDDSGSLTDPTTISHVITLDGSGISGSPFNLAAHTKISTGIYDIDVDFDTAGTYKGVFTASTASDKVTEAWIIEVSAA